MGAKYEYTQQEVHELQAEQWLAVARVLPDQSADCISKPGCDCELEL